jgi:hypothetical protein
MPIAIGIPIDVLISYQLNRHFPTSISLTSYVNGFAERISFISARPLKTTKTLASRFGS